MDLSDEEIFEALGMLIERGYVEHRWNDELNEFEYRPTEKGWKALEKDENAFRADNPDYYGDEDER